MIAGLARVSACRRLQSAPRAPPEVAPEASISRANRSVGADFPDNRNRNNDDIQSANKSREANTLDGRRQIHHPVQVGLLIGPEVGLRGAGQAWQLKSDLRKAPD